MNDQQQTSGGTDSILGNSILDKIISSQEDKAKEAFSPQETIMDLLKKLNNKEAEVLKYRFGLSGYKKETLESIGQRYEVTRERIRQIENLAINKIKESSDFVDLIKPVEQVLNSVLEDYGKVMDEDFLLEQVFIATPKNEINVRSVLFILSKLLNDSLVRVANKKYKSSWKVKTFSLEFLEEVVEELKKIIEVEGEPMSLEKIVRLFEQTNFYKENEGKLNKKVVESYLEISVGIDRNPFEQYGLLKWGSVKPKRMNDKIKLLLEKEKKPMHFVEISEKITQIFKKKAYPPTVHNELILNKEYVLVGRGIYALKEWGYKKGVVADVLENILKAAEKPLFREELVKKVLERRIVKKNTIHLALTNKEKFKKLDDGRYTLV